MSESQQSESALQQKVKPSPQIRTLSTADVRHALASGIRDFVAVPVYGLGLGAIYAIGGWILFIFLSVFSMPFLVYPLATGFVLIAPFVAAGLYDISKRREQDLELSWSAMTQSVLSAGRRDLGWMALVAGFALIIWMDIAAFLFFGFIGFRPLGLAELVTEILTTPSGLAFLIIGNLSGAVLAFAVFSISVISVPLLFDRKVDFVTAMVTSVKSVRQNPGPMLMWFVFVSAILGLGLVTALVGLMLALPILGHASWHLYRKTIE